MANTLFHVSSTELTSLAAAWENKKKPADYTFDGFVLTVSDDGSSLLFYPLYRNKHTDEGVRFISQLTADPCPNPPGYDKIIDSWRTIDPNWTE